MYSTQINALHASISILSVAVPTSFLFEYRTAQRAIAKLHKSQLQNRRLAVRADKNRSDATTAATKGTTAITDTTAAKTEPESELNADVDADIDADVVDTSDSPAVEVDDSNTAVVSQQQQEHEREGEHEQEGQKSKKKSKRSSRTRKHGACLCRVLCLYNNDCAVICASKVVSRHLSFCIAAAALYQSALRLLRIA